MLELTTKTVNKTEKVGFPLVEKLIDISSYPVIKQKRISSGQRILTRSWVRILQIRCKCAPTRYCDERISSVPVSRNRKRHRNNGLVKKLRFLLLHGSAIR